MRLFIFNIVTLFFFSTFINAQIGINTSVPNAAFDVAVNPNIPVNEDVVGIKIPIISKQQLGNKGVYNTSKKGTIVFVDGLSYTGNNSQVANVEDDKYFYIFDGSSWKSSVYTLSGSGFIVQSSNEQGFEKNNEHQEVILKQSGDLIIPQDSEIFEFSGTNHLVAKQKGMIMA